MFDDLSNTAAQSELIEFETTSIYSEEDVQSKQQRPNTGDIKTIRNTSGRIPSKLSQARLTPVSLHGKDILHSRYVDAKI